MSSQLTRRTALRTISLTAFASLSGIRLRAAVRKSSVVLDGSYGLDFRHPPEDLIGDLLHGERGDPRDAVRHSASRVVFSRGPASDARLGAQAAALSAATGNRITVNRVAARAGHRHGVTFPRLRLPAPPHSRLESAPTTGRG